MAATGPSSSLLLERGDEVHPVVSPVIVDGGKTERGPGGSQSHRWSHVVALLSGTLGVTMAECVRLHLCLACGAAREPEFFCNS
ncbi:MAG: hypothetical protein K0A98_01535 [Trueperaceae bacterium]|nr:hypothetical protein [Trueperaceae bacterium]